MSTAGIKNIDGRKYGGTQELPTEKITTIIIEQQFNIPIFC